MTDQTTHETYRERRERKAERLRGWADTRRTEAEATLETDRKRYRGNHAFNTQPGHIPERARAIARTDRAFTSLRKADGMSSRAAGIDSQAAHAIYSDDPDAIERLVERIAGLEAEREQIKATNARYRKDHRDELRELTPYGRSQAVPYPSYVLQNLGGNIARQKKRLAALRNPAPHRLRSIAARRDGDCSACDDRIERAATITEIEPHTWVHASCATEGAAVCPGCGCLWDDHRTLAAWLESDDPLEVAQRCSPDFTGPIDLCGDCGACADERGP